MLWQSHFAGVPDSSSAIDGQYLFSSDHAGLSRWDVSDGSRTGYFLDSSRRISTEALVNLRRLSMKLSFDGKCKAPNAPQPYLMAIEQVAE